jgi:sec-independent protein translocase protein TatA
MPFGIQPLHIVIIVVVALLIFGPKRLPEIGRYIGKTITEFRNGTQEFSQGLREEVNKPLSSTSAPLAASTATQPLPSAAGGKYCTQCGSPNPAEARFCGKCGNRLVELTV